MLCIAQEKNTIPSPTECSQHKGRIGSKCGYAEVTQSNRYWHTKDAILAALFSFSVHSTIIVQKETASEGKKVKGHRQLTAARVQKLWK